MFEYLYDYINIYIKCSRDSDGFLEHTNIGGEKFCERNRKTFRCQIEENTKNKNIIFLYKNLMFPPRLKKHFTLNKFFLHSLDFRLFFLSLKGG